MPAPRALLKIPTSWGTLCVSFVGGRISGCQLPPAPDGRPIPLALLPSMPAGDTAIARAAARYLKALFAGRPARCPPLALPPGGPFTQRAWRSISSIPRGCVLSYAELSAQAGSPRAARAAGQACATNAIPLFIPCHRVVAADGKLGGFTGGLAWKRHLLALEGVS